MKKYVFRPYSKNFPRLFEKEKQRIVDFVKEEIVVEHIGSTAIPNMGGKGIIDMTIAISRDKMELTSQKIQKLGYVFKPTASTPDRLFLRIDLPDPEEGTRIHHIHLTYLSSKDWKEMLAFRDYLISNPKEARKYAEVKKKAADQANGDREKYVRIKEPTIHRILTKLLQEKRFS